MAAPIGYLAVVLLASMIIARRRAERDRLALAEAPVDLDTRPVQRYEPISRPVVADDEADRPRWLRPSLRAERLGVEVGQRRVMPAALRYSPPPSRTPLAFGGVPDDLGDRGVIGAGVDLIDQPDQAAGQRVVGLEPGDEVAILDRGGGWLNVLTPTGAAGWLPSAAVSGRPVDIAAPDWSAQPAAAPRATPSVGEEPLDLADFLAARRSLEPIPPTPAEDEPPGPLRSRRPRKPSLGEPGLS
jgi:hypothetical protein